MFKRYLMVAAFAAVLAGCGSNVKLDPPIEGSGADATATTGPLASTWADPTKLLGMAATSLGRKV
jgi:uncharacterized protein YceK